MNDVNRNLPVRLLTVPEAAERLGVMIADLDRLVDDGRLEAVPFSARAGRRFWPADVEAAAAGPRRLDRPADGPDVPAGRDAAPAAAAAGRRPAPPRRATTPTHPRWARDRVTPERVPSTYLAFRDADHVTSYLQARATLLLDADRSVHGVGEVAAADRELVRR